MTANAKLNFATEAQNKLKLVWNETTGKVKGAIQEAEKDARGLVTKLDDNRKKTIQDLKTQLHVDELLSRVQLTALLEQGSKIGQDAAEKLGIATAEELNALSGQLDALAKKATARTRPSVTKRDFDALKKNVEALEAQLKKLAASVPATPKKANSKPVAKKPAAKKPAAKKPSARK